MKTSSLGLSTDQGTLLRTRMKTGVRTASTGPAFHFWPASAHDRSEIIRLNLIWIIPAKGLMRFSAFLVSVKKLRIY